MKSFILISTLFLSILTHAAAQCFKSNTKELQNITVYKSTGNAELDKVLNAEKAKLESVYKIKVDLKIMDDSKAPNAYATTESTNPYSFHGTVYLGFNLLNSELKERQNGIYAVIGIMAHEFAHILQGTLDCQLESSVRELHADFLAGYYVAVRGGFENEAEIAAFGESLYKKGDSELWDESHHGTPKQRLNIMLAGYKLSATLKTPKDAYYAGVNILTNGGDKGELSSTETVDNEQTTTKPTPSVKPQVTPKKTTQTPRQPQQEVPQKAQSVAVTLPNGVHYDQVFSVKFTIGEHEHKGVLVLKNGVGKMRLHFIKPSCGQQHLVDQNMTVKNGANGTVIVGSSPFDVNEEGYKTDYHADSFYFIKNQSGELEVWNMDAAGNKARVYLTLLTNENDANEWLEDVDWH